MVLTQEQNDFLAAEGRVVLCAVPGSGKTFIVAKKLQQYLNTWSNKHRGIAALSFTNVASDEIKRQVFVNNDSMKNIEHPHFIGTLDSFINKFIFLRFGYLMNPSNKNRPIIIHENYGELSFSASKGDCYKKGCTRNPTQFYWSIDGLTKNGSPIECKCEPKPCREYKQRLFQKGIFIQREVPTFALRILRKYPQIAKELAYRFPIIIVDEAQDTSREQMELLDCLSQAGVETLILVGDPDQALYEWRDATPEYFIQKMNDPQWQTMFLSCNFRSSQLICNAAQSFSSVLYEKNPAQATGEWAAYKQKPILLSVSKGKSKQDIIDSFLQICRENSIVISEQNVSVLTRSKIHSNLVTDVWKTPETESLALASYLWHTGSRIEAFRLCEKVLYSIEIDTPYKMTSETIRTQAEDLFTPSVWKKKVVCLLQHLPSPHLSIACWKTAIQKTLVFLSESSIIVPREQITLSKVIKIKRSDKHHPDFLDRQVIDYFEKRSTESYTMSSVHGVKGETFEATLLIVDSTRGNGTLTPKVLNTESLDNELIRIAYVAMTRPRKILVVSVPQTATDMLRFSPDTWDYRNL